MSWLALWLLAIAVMDLVRPVVEGRRELAPAIGAGVLVVLTALTGMIGVADMLVLAASLAPMAGWWWFSERAQGSRGRDHLLALGSLGGGGLLLLALSGWAGLPGGALGTWLGWADLPLLGGPMSPERMRFVLLVAALLLANLATGNIVVRLVLVAIGALRPGARVGTQPADRLKGGRLLGPMERLLILGLGLAGQLTAAGLVIGAKGLIRFPELQSRAKDGTAIDGLGIDEMTEYFLIGSFASWLLALGSLALLH
ncbi:MAG: hypothetical protein M9923_06595 [Phycicoccus sp.]|jgi:hypothetical protein|uniref:hypothetical protein n=1 Tax=Phycicoccus TaxID=367298 RepID=UPI001D6521E3|nr:MULTISPECIES: hypothetical protein [Phycicoccus]MCB1239160.1 hypothetical protein [Tetrasphaera sp.]MCB9405780.1 hypothetical protein [Tetrasphaera sp.]MCO5302873.1 hypothetical protein [Phycicoccus sp.]HPQ73280.1 hypothetical protein [Phycicoccus elongatus]